MPDEFEPAGLRPVELLVLVAALDADEPPGQVVVHRRHRARWHDEAEERERPVGRTEEQPLADTSAHPALARRLLVALREPCGIGEKPGEERLDPVARVARRRRLTDVRAHLADDLAHAGRVEDVLVVLQWRQRMLEFTQPASRSLRRRFLLTSLLLSVAETPWL